MTVRSGSNWPDKITAIRERGFVTWAVDADTSRITPEFAARFHARRIPVSGVRNVRVWGIQVDDERTLPGRERTAIPDEEVWEINLEALDGSHYEVSSDLVEPAPA